MFKVNAAQFLIAGRLLLILLCFAAPKVSLAQCINYQRVYVSTKESNSNVNGGGGNTDVSNENGSLGSNLSDYSTITVPPSHLARYSRLGFSKTFTNGEPIHIKLSSTIDFRSTSITAEVQAYYNGSPVGTKVVLSDPPYLDVIGGENISDIVVASPGAMYNAVQVTITGGFPPAGNTHEIRIYAAYVNELVTTPIDCNTAADVFTGTVGGELSSNNMVVNPSNATDANFNSYAEMKQNVGASGYVHLTSLLSSPTVSGDLVSVTLQIPNVFPLDAGIFSRLSVIAYLGNTQVAAFAANDPNISVTLVNSNSGIYRFTYPVNASFDRISVRIGGVPGAYNTVYLYDVRSILPTPVIKVNNVAASSATFCQSANATLSIDPTQACTTYNTYDAATGGNLLYSQSSYTLNSLPAGTYVYYVEASRNNCNATTSARTKMTLVVDPLPGVTLGSVQPVCIGSAGTSLPFTATSGSPSTYSITWNAAATVAGFSDVGATVFPASPIPVTIAAGTAAGTYQGTLLLKNANNCTATVNFEIQIKPISPTPFLNLNTN